MKPQRVVSSPILEIVIGADGTHKRLENGTVIPLTFDQWKREIAAMFSPAGQQRIAEERKRKDEQLREQERGVVLVQAQQRLVEQQEPAEPPKVVTRKPRRV